MTTNQPEPQGIAEYDAREASSDVISPEQSTPDLSAIKRILLAMILGVVVGQLAGRAALSGNRPNVTVPAKGDGLPVGR